MLIASWLAFDKSSENRFGSEVQMHLHVILSWKSKTFRKIWLIDLVLGKFVEFSSTFN